MIKKINIDVLNTSCASPNEIMLAEKYNEIIDEIKSIKKEIALINEPAMGCGTELSEIQEETKASWQDFLETAREWFDKFNTGKREDFDTIHIVINMKRKYESVIDLMQKEIQENNETLDYEFKRNQGLVEELKQLKIKE